VAAGAGESPEMTKVKFTPPPKHNLTDEQVAQVKNLIGARRNVAQIIEESGLPEDQVRIVIAEHNRAFRKR
jgi:hypothetical protein